MALIVRISLEKGWERLIFWNDNSLYCCRLCGHTIQQAGWDCSVELGTTSIGGLGTGFPNVAVLQASWSWTLFLNKLQCLINLQIWSTCSYVMSDVKGRQVCDVRWPTRAPNPSLNMREFANSEMPGEAWSFSSFRRGTWIWERGKVMKDSSSVLSIYNFCA